MVVICEFVNFSSSDTTTTTIIVLYAIVQMMSQIIVAKGYNVRVVSERLFAEIHLKNTSYLNITTYSENRVSVIPH